MTPKTYCNPIPLPDYPRGRNTRPENKRETKPHSWRGRIHRDFRETADPTVLWHGGKWYLYPSCGMAWVTEDFATWTHHPLEPDDVGYAPTVVAFRGRFLMTACGAPLWIGETPLGPFRKAEAFVTTAGKAPPRWMDPMLFADDDGRLYAYWGLSAPGIFGAELDGDHPHRMVTEEKVLFSYNPDHEWERVGDWNEDASKSYVEGPWMQKIGGRYYLTYAAPGTQWRTYGMGAYVSDKPLGPFTYQDRNPILSGTGGMIRGPGHGCLVEGPGKTLWAFYTLTVCSEHVFERRVGMDPAGIDADGNLFVKGPSEIPQRVPGEVPHPVKGNDAGWLPLTQNKAVEASSEREGREAEFAVDGYLRTWWQPAEGDTAPRLVVYLNGSFELNALRLQWKERGLHYENGVVPGPVKYLVEALVDEAADKWVSLVDATANGEDLLIDYRTFPPVTGSRVRLLITGHAPGIQPGVMDFTVFGKATRFGYGPA